ncbi:MAG: crotonase/enoyl-CoA hydratase family protein [Bacteroidota bacterium]
MIDLKIENKIAIVTLNRPDKANSVNKIGWEQLKNTFDLLDTNDEVRVIVLNGGESKHFCGGIDLEMLMSISQETIKCQGRKNELLRKIILDLQAPINSIENCSKPVLAAINGGCIGAGVDIVSACDIRYCTDDTFFTIKEIDMGMVADLGTLQRLPKIIGEGKVREMAYTGRNVSGKEAEKIGLVNNCFENKEIMMENVMKIAEQIASKSPLSIRGTKHILLHTRDHTVAQGLEYMATWNAAMLISNDLMEAFAAKMQKREAKFD